VTHCGKIKRFYHNAWKTPGGVSHTSHNLYYYYFSALTTDIYPGMKGGIYQSIRGGIYMSAVAFT
jgi:hypothetical protein